MFSQLSIATVNNINENFLYIYLFIQIINHFVDHYCHTYLGGVRYVVYHIVTTQ